MRYFSQLPAVIVMASGLAAATYAEQMATFEYDVGYEAQRIERIRYRADEPLRAEHDYGRLASLTHAGVVGVTVNDILRLSASLGTMSMEVHTGEGQTFEYDGASVFGLSATYLVSKLPIPDLSAEIGVRYRAASSDDEDVTFVARDELTDDGDAELTWQETALFAVLSYRIPGGSLFRCGVESVSLDVEQDWTFDLGRSDITTTFEPESSWAFMTGFSHPILDHWLVFADVTGGHRVAFSGGLRYQF